MKQTKAVPKYVIKECPFCGSKSVLTKIPKHNKFINEVEFQEGDYFIECIKCKNGLAGNDLLKLIVAWNERIKL